MSTSAAIVTCKVCGRKNRVPAAASGVPHCSNCHAALPWLAEADDPSYREVVEASRLPVLLDLWAPWCGPCRMVSPLVEKLGADFAGKVKVVKVNVDEAPGIAARFEVQGIPTLVVLHHGQVVERQTGAAPEPVLRSWLERALQTITVQESSA
ncbi:MAG: Thioredoxin [Actinomycetia bacterium]|nr:Thioredoxin [Actinomycetes bacterium]